MDDKPHKLYLSENVIYFVLGLSDDSVAVSVISLRSLKVITRLFSRFCCLSVQLLFLFKELVQVCGRPYICLCLLHCTLLLWYIQVTQTDLFWFVFILNDFLFKYCFPTMLPLIFLLRWLLWWVLGLPTQATIPLNYFCRFVQHSGWVPNTTFPFGRLLFFSVQSRVNPTNCIFNFSDNFSMSRVLKVSLAWLRS